MPTCQLCKQPTVPITVVDHTHGGVVQGLAYTVNEEPDVSAWTGKIKNRAGTLHAHLCPACNHVMWFAVPET